ncbi:MAG: zinc ribbon domain-containing protein [Nitrososphaeria archaeon]|jgi:MFS family permease
MGSKSKPTTAYVLSLISGVLIFIGGICNLIVSVLVRAYIRTFLGRYRPPLMLIWRPGLGIVWSIVGMAFGVIVIYSALMLNSAPKNHTMWGTLILVFSLLSFMGALAGLGAGLILGVVGGVLVINWKEPALTPTAVLGLTVKYCVQCGQAIPADAKFCPHCGKEAPA